MSYGIKRQSDNEARVTNPCNTISEAERTMLQVAYRDMEDRVLRDSSTVALVAGPQSVTLHDLRMGRCVAMYSVTDMDPVHRELDLTAETAELRIVGGDRFNMGRNWER